MIGEPSQVLAGLDDEQQVVATGVHGQVVVQAGPLSGRRVAVRFVNAGSR